MGREATNTLYAGTFERSMDAKKRVAVPASWLSLEEGEEFHVVPPPEKGYLMVMPHAEFERWEQRIMESDMPAPKKRVAIRHFYASSHLVTADKQGRILLPETHCEQAGLTGEIVFIGSKSRFEIWSKDRFQHAQADEEAIYREVAEAIGL